LALLLEIERHETHIAHDGRSALAAVEHLTPDAVLLDIGLPGLNGYEVSRRMRDAPWGKRLTIIALTGWGQEEDRRRSKAAGFDGHLIKPGDSELLLKLIADLDGPRVSSDVRPRDHGDDQGDHDLAAVKVNAASNP
jgi:CheY-like chemotaxis protein